MRPEELDELERIAKAARAEIAADKGKLAAGKPFVLDTDADDAFHDYVTPERVLALLSLLRDKERGSAQSQPCADEGPQPRSPDDQGPSAACPTCGGRRIVHIVEGACAAAHDEDCPTCVGRLVNGIRWFSTVAR